MKNKTCSLALFILLFMGRSPVIAQKAPSINHLALSVINLKQSVLFYAKVIALDSIPEPFKDGKHAWFSIGDNISLHLIEDAPAVKTYYKNSHLCFSTLNLAAFIEKLKRNGIEYENVMGAKGAITKRVDGVQQIYFRDPDGYWIEMNDAKS